MNRYTYKGISKTTGEWVYGDLLNWYDTENNNEHNVCIIPIEVSVKNKSIRDFIVDKDTLCQCTGLQIRNKIYIYEHDYIKTGANNICEVLWDDEDGTWYCHNYKNNTKFLLGRISKTCEIIGNKFDEVKE